MNQNSSKREIVVALVGNPNVGKTSILRHLVKGNLKIGNWPGVTVEKKEGTTTFQNYTIKFIDLPGIYSLERPSSEDEKVTVDFLSNENYHVILNVIETPKMERDIFLTIELLKLKKPMIIVLNMMDEVEKLGIKVDIKRLEDLLRIPVHPVIGATGEGVIHLLPLIVETYEKQRVPRLKPYILRSCLSEKEETKKNLALAKGLLKEVFFPPLSLKETLSDVFDKFILHPVFGVLFFLFVMCLAFKLTFDFSYPFIDFLFYSIETLIIPCAVKLCSIFNPPLWVYDFIVNGIIKSVGTVLSFIPLIFFIFLFLTLLETTGYLPRISFLMDRITHKLGLHGQAVIPVFLGFGCNVPALLATRTFHNKKDKFLTMVIIPFVSCPPRLLIFTFICTYFFPKKMFWIIIFLYLFGILTGFFSSYFLRRLVFKKGLEHFVMELPPYRKPPISLLTRISWEHLKEYIKKAGTLIFFSSVVLWTVFHFPYNKPFKDSIGARIAQKLTFIFEPIGLGNWEITTAIFSGLVARENIIATIQLFNSRKFFSSQDIENFKNQKILEGLSKVSKKFVDSIFQSLKNLLNPVPEVFNLSETQKKNQLYKVFTSKSAFIFMLFILLCNLCLPTTFTFFTESRNLHYTFLFLLYNYTLSWIICFIFYHLF